MKFSEIKSVLPWIIILLVLFPLSFFLGVEKEGLLEMHVDTSKLEGIRLWLTDLYNTQRFSFAFVVTLTMATVGVTIAFVTDFILKLFGLEVGKIQHHE
ncbi:MAG: hypothetical protein A2X61_14490 [Ignavibacteria bacterium GWB2_35_12]|nr:MAG: hypothetical protein A2X61_14490 [Ignavibacteria bacterium GWB2_35_12]OGU94715.1 MAG: hypothetical protein A2220_04045 [Ignavibacteria bacterium RIFOXYA2_FULL_35_10]OGV22927.1 MAG: hypothetical protein A2475_10650 [Ignavibacteria bacterium RIFOXYC2_FULL_35_21]